MRTAPPSSSRTFRSDRPAHRKVVTGGRRGAQRADRRAALGADHRGARRAGRPGPAATRLLGVHRHDRAAQDKGGAAAEHRLLGRLRDANVLGVLVAGEHRVFEANDAFLDIIGYTRDDLEAGRITWGRSRPRSGPALKTKP